MKRNPKKDPNAPKRAMSAYMMFVLDKRQEIKRQNPNASFGEIGKMVADRWMAMTEEVGGASRRQSEEDKARYLKEKQEYDARQDDEEENKSDDESSSEEESKPSKVCCDSPLPLSRPFFPGHFKLTRFVYR